jgi:hypothetical protein
VTVRSSLSYYRLYIPTIPTIVLAKKIFRGEYSIHGARPCVSLVPLEELLEQMREYDIIETSLSSSCF